MFKISLKSYPTIKPEYELVKWNKKNEVLFLISYPTKKEVGEKWEVNEAAFDVLSLINGKRSLSKIIELLQEKYSQPRNEIVDKVIALIRDLVSIGMVNIQNQAKESKREVIEINSDYWLKVLGMEITKRCNLKCKHCYVRGNEEEMPIEKIKNIIDQGKKIGVESVTLTGGEPFLREDVFEILNYIDSKNMRVRILSNGTLIDRETAKRLQSLKNVFLSISLDGPKDVHEKLRRVKGCFDKTLNGIKNLIEFGLRPRISFTLSKYALGRSKEVLKIVKELGYSKPPDLGFVLNLGRAKEYEICVTPEEYAKELKEYWKAAKQIFNLKEFIIAKSNKGCCWVGKEPLIVTSEGNIIPCTMLNQDPFILGNIYYDTLEDVWNHSPILKRIRNIDLRRNKKCKKCNHLAYCVGGCRVSAMVSTNNIEGFFRSHDPYACAFFDALGDDIKVVEKADSELFLK